MGDEDQLQSLAKRLVNIYNACKWSKTKLHIRKKRRKFCNTDDQPQSGSISYAEIESESSTKTIFVYDRNIRTRTEKNEDNEGPSGLTKYLETFDQKILFSQNIHNQFRNDQSVNVCTCKRCICDPGKGTYEVVDKGRSSESRRKSSKLAISLNSKQDESGSKFVTKGCCCGAPLIDEFPISKKKSTIKTQRVYASEGKDCMCQCGPVVPYEQCPYTTQMFSPYYPPLEQTSRTSKTERCECCPTWAPKKKCVCPAKQTVSCFCQCALPEPPKNTCCQCPPSGGSCCQCPPSPNSSEECCPCPPACPPKKKTNCCQCTLPLPKCPLPIGCQCNSQCCDYDVLVPYDLCECPPVIENNMCIRAERIVIPTMYFNQGNQATPSGNLSYASEEVRNVLLNRNSSILVYQTSDKGMNTSCVFVKDCPSEEKHAARAKQQAYPEKFGTNGPQNKIGPSSSPNKLVAGASLNKLGGRASLNRLGARGSPHRLGAKGSPHKLGLNFIELTPTGSPNKLSARVSSIRPCYCRRKNLRDQGIDTSSYMVLHSQASLLRRQRKDAGVVARGPDKICQGTCCACNNNNNLPVQNVSNMAYEPFSDERFIAKYSPHPHMYPPYDRHAAGGFPMIPGIVPPPRFLDHSALLRSQSTPLCCQQLLGQIPKGPGGDEKIPGINTDTEAEIYATLHKIETTMRDEADMHSRNVRCIVDQVCKQGGDIKELKVLVAGVVETKKTPTCKDVEKKIKKLETRKEKEARRKLEEAMEERERMRESHPSKTGLDPLPSNQCCKCGSKKKRRRYMGCWGKCCAKRCNGCCGTCCGGCCPKFCNSCCYPFEKWLPCCCCIARCCDTFWSCRFFSRRKKKKCRCSN